MVNNSNTKAQKLRPLLFKGLRNESPVTLAPNLTEAEDRHNFDIETIISQLQPVIEEQVAQYFQAWKQTYQQKLTQFGEKLEELSARLEQLEQDAATIGAIWQELEGTLNVIYAWTGQFSQEVSATKLKENWQSQFSEILQTVSECVDIPIPPDCWIISPGDSFQQRLLKIKRRTEDNLKHTLLSMRNQMRRLLRISPLDPFPARRRVHLRFFLACYVGIPLAEFLVAEWLQCLQQVTGQFYELHTRLGAIKDEFLLLNDSETASLQFNSSKLRNQLENLQNHIEAITTYSQQLDHFEIEVGQRFQTYQVDLYDNVRSQWYLVSTYRLPNASFDEEQVVNGWRNVELRETEATNRWIGHFQAEQGCWQVTLELAFLQLETARNCSQILNIVEQRINRQVIPAFLGTQETIAAFLEKFATLKKNNSASLTNAIAEQNRFILQSLQQENLPQLMDELIAVQLTPALGSGNASRIRNAIECIADKHIIFRYRDLDNPLPKSNAEVIPTIKKVVLENLFPKLETGYQAVNAENRQVVEKLIRGISDVDQAIEVNLKRASLHLIRNQGEEVIEETRLAITAELNRTTLQLNELVAQAEQLLTTSQKDLLKITRDFQNQLQHLINTEELTEAYLQLTGKSVSGKVLVYRRRLLATIKTGIPSLFRLLLNTFQQFRSSYSRLRKMAGLTPDKADAAKNLSQFLADTEKHISALPYVYQRLFRLEPLRDEQFFVAREKELELLKNEFDRWQMGRFTATAIIGERGCGITTLLNLAEKQIYKDYPVIKINFLDGETIFTEEALFDFLKSTFKETDLKKGLKNLDELEHKINALEERKIFIVENLQQLFLRTTYGFDALERFLLFISRTHQKIHWVMTCAIYSWEYLAKVININEYVQREIVLDALSQAEFQNIIFARHRVSGYQLDFQTTDKIANSRRFKKLNSNQAQQTYLQNLFFKQLTELAAGNITVAILLWLRSYTEFSQDKLIFPPAINFDPTFLYQLPAEELFTLVAVLQHDILNAEHHARVFHQDIQHSLLLLNRMASKGILVQKPNGCQIHPFLYRPVVRVLKSGNIIH